VAATPGKTTAPPASAAQDLSSGDVLDGKYRIEEKLGQGGMGAVYRAVHLGTKRTVAIKVIRPRFASDEEFIARFRREAEAAGRLRHPNVVDVTDFGFASVGGGRVAYLVMEYLDGCTLAEVLAEEKTLSREWVVDILTQACSAVEEAHRVGLIHRDLKPDNIWLEPNRRGGYTVKVLDFGLVKMEPAPAAPRLLPTPAAPLPLTEAPTVARAGVEETPAPAGRASSLLPSAGWPLEDAPDTLTRVGSVMGTPLYMSPEQCRGEDLDARSDVYSLGVVAYRMLAGRTPFSGTAEELVRLHTGARPDALTESMRIPRAMSRVIMTALAKDRADRPRSAAGFAAALRAAAEGSGTLLRQALALYGERFPAFFRVSILAYAPLIAVVVLLYLIDGDPAWIRLPPRLAAVGPALLVTMVVANILAYDIVSAVTVPLVVESILAPLRPLRSRTAFAALRPRARTFALATVAVMAIVGGGALLLVVPGILGVLAHALYAPVTVMEDGGVGATLRRARLLARRSWATVLVITALQFALPIVVWIVSVDVAVTLKLDESHRPAEFGYRLSSSGDTALFQLLNVFVTPLTAIMTALLYLKTRQAGGESLLDAVERFDALQVPRSAWQMRLRSRLRSSGQSAGSSRSV
jgi:serine/threonine protein kinase